MAKNATDLTNEIMLEGAPLGVVLFKNPRGVFKLASGGYMKAGLGPNGASDTVGYVRRKITQDMVGKIFAQFAIFEVKFGKDTVKQNQNDFINTAVSHGAIGGICRSVQDFKALVGGICGSQT